MEWLLAFLAELVFWARVDHASHGSPVQGLGLSEEMYKK
jgi:hypothetical protein